VRNGLADTGHAGFWYGKSGVMLLVGPLYEEPAFA
jgi:hypothetical protein